MAEEIVTSREDSFARFTILNRIPGIVKDLLANNRLPRETEKGLEELYGTLPRGPLSPLSGDYPFAGEINRTLAEHGEYAWLNGPFLFLENYLYHRIADLCRYFTKGYDYFLYRKEKETLKGLDRFSGYLEKTDAVTPFSEISLLNLMGNRADLSQDSSYYSSDSPSELLIDHRARAAVKIGGCARVDIILDNAGEELFFDLLLAYWLLKHKGTDRVVLHFKAMPYFVSDALISDYRLLITLLAGRKGTARFAGEMDRFEGEGRITLKADPFFVSGKLFSRMGPELSRELARSDLIIIKGDLNYRRLVGDSYWPLDRRTSDLVNYFPSDILISRILKSEVLVGIEPERIPDRERKDWMYGGKFGQIEFIPGSA